MAAASLMASALLIAPPFGSAADITGEDGYTWKVEADNPEGRVTGSAADGYTITLDKEKQSAQLQVVFPNLLEQAFSLNTKYPILVDSYGQGLNSLPQTERSRKS